MMGKKEIKQKMHMGKEKIDLKEKIFIKTKEH